MTITKPAKKSKVEAVAAAVPDARPTAQLRGRKRQLGLTLPPQLVARIDAVATKEKRSRANMIELILDQYLQARQQSDAA